MKIVSAVDVSKVMSLISQSEENTKKKAKTLEISLMTGKKSAKKFTLVKSSISDAQKLLIEPGTLFYSFAVKTFEETKGTKKKKAEKLLLNENRVDIILLKSDTWKELDVDLLKSSIPKSSFLEHFNVKGQIAIYEIKTQSKDSAVVGYFLILPKI